jgi:hypothetical protein
LYFRGRSFALNGSKCTLKFGMCFRLAIEYSTDKIFLVVSRCLRMAGLTISYVRNGFGSHLFHKPVHVTLRVNPSCLYTMGMVCMRRTPCVNLRSITISFCCLCLRILHTSYNHQMLVYLVHFSVHGQTDVTRLWRTLVKKFP